MAAHARSDFFHAARHATQIDEGKLARFLGWFSIGLGLTETVAPGAIARIAGTKNNSRLIRSYGLREITSGVGILTNPRPAGWVWSRVGGDVLDLASLAASLGSKKHERGKTLGAMAAVAGVTALDVVCAQRLSAQEKAEPQEGAARAKASILVNRSPEECYRFWRNVENLPRFMTFVESVRATGEKQAHWVAKTPGNTACLEWDSEMVEDVPNKRISWRTLPGSPVFNTGSVEFEAAPRGRGTIVRVRMEYKFPGHKMASTLGKLAGKDPESRLEKDLRRFKQVLETGEAITTEGQPAGRRSGTTWLDNIAR